MLFTHNSLFRNVLTKSFSYTLKFRLFGSLCAGFSHQSTDKIKTLLHVFLLHAFKNNSRKKQPELFIRFWENSVSLKVIRTESLKVYSTVSITRFHFIVTRKTFRVLSPDVITFWVCPPAPAIDKAYTGPVDKPEEWWRQVTKPEMFSSYSICYSVSKHTYTQIRKCDIPIANPPITINIFLPIFSTKYIPGIVAKKLMAAFTITKITEDCIISNPIPWNNLAA